MGTVSILVATRDRDAYLFEALGSLRRQTHSAWEAVVVDNGTSRGTRDVVMGAGDGRIRYVKAPRNLGECGGRNLAFARSTGDYVCYLDDDDLLPPDSLEKRVRFLRAQRACGMIYGEYERFRTEGARRVEVVASPRHPWLTKRYYDRLLERLGYGQAETFHLLKIFNFIRGGTPLVRRHTLAAVGLFDEALANHGDYEMWLRIARRFPIRFLAEVVYLYRVHPGSTQASVHPAAAADCAERIRRRYAITHTLQFGLPAAPTPAPRPEALDQGGHP